MNEQCSLPPALEAYELDMYLDDDADAQIVHHIELCEFCRSQMEKRQVVLNQIKERLYRLSCPSAATLRDYYFQHLSSSQQNEVGWHVEHCPHCTKELFEDYSDIELSEEMSRAGLLDRINMMIARYIPNPDVSLTPALGVARDSEAAEASESNYLIFQTDEFDISLEFRPEEENNNVRFMLEGQVFEKTRHDLSSFAVHLWQGAQLVATTSLDEVGDFAFTHLVSGNYSLVISGPDTKIWLTGILIEQP